MDPTGASISGTLAVGSAGSYSVTVVVTDHAGATASAQFTWSVTTPANTPTGTAVQTSPKGSTGTPATITLTFPQVSAKGDTTVAPINPIGLVIGGFALGTPPLVFDLATSAQYVGPVVVCVNFTASQFTTTSHVRLMHREGGVWVDRTVSIDVASRIVCGSVPSFSPFAVAERLNRAPVLQNPGSQTSAEGQAVSLQFAATDADGDALTFGATGLPAGLHVSPAGLVSGTPSDQSAGSYAVTVKATDGKLTATQAYTWTVVDMSGRMNGDGQVASSGLEHHFTFKVTERKDGADHGRVEFWIRDPDTAKKKGKELNRFDAATITAVTFSDDPGFKPGKKPLPTIDSVSFGGVGEWNGKRGYTFQAHASDQGEPGAGRDTFAITIRDPKGATVATVSGTLAGGNIQSLRLAGRHKEK